MPLFPDVRPQFPALQRRQEGSPVAYFDGPAGSQVPQSVLDAVAGSLRDHNANRGAPIGTSREIDAIIDAAQRAAADFFGASDPDEVVYGPNMTSLTYQFSRAIESTWRPGDEIILSRLDHDANFTPWVQAAARAGAKVRCIDVRLDDCTLDLDSFRRQLNERTRLVAVGYASNATGTINPVREIVRGARDFGAITYVDAVHYAPHGLIDVTDLGCDFLVCSAYKFFGPHVGVLWGRRELLETLPAAKLRPSPTAIPHRWMTGTQNHEGIAGTLAAIDYLADVARRIAPEAASRRAALRAAFAGITEYERELVRPLLAFLREQPGLRVWGITDPQRLALRVPTISVTHARLTPRELAARLQTYGLWTWAGNHYAVPFTSAAGLEPDGTLRIGLLHYNTAEEVQRLIDALDQILGT
jgi:cysteine desulfurase family protein (TIGR01976 family)